ncbi:MAG: maleylacetoacetate isomerase [Myxococcota bacterium]
MRLRLYGYWRSSSAWRVRIALGLKGLEYESRPVHLLRNGGEQHEADYLRLNPMAQLPTLEVEERGELRHLTQSLAIIDWLEQLQPEPSILSSEPWARFRALEIAEIVNSGMQPLQNLSVLQAVERLGSSKQEWVRPFLTRGLAALERKLDGGPFALGEQPSLADLCIVPQLYSTRRFGIDLGDFPSLLRVEATCRAHPAFEAAHPDRQVDAKPKGN